MWNSISNLKVCRAAVLTLVGWYLMVAPPRQPSWFNRALIWAENGHLVVEYDTDAPLSKWTQSDEFESLSECQLRLANVTTDAERRMEAIDAHKTTTWAELDKKAILQRFLYSRCVASDDPRLKGN
jgi:hypothetical protein